VSLLARSVQTKRSQRIAPMPDAYRPHGAVEGMDDGRPVRLKLQERVDLAPCEFYTMSWRTAYPGSTNNRRFYWVGDACWTLAALLGRDLLERADAEGMLATRYDDPYARFGGGSPSFVDSVSVTPGERASIWREITREGLEPNWGSNPLFSVATEAGGRWRKIMIVDERRRMATFRSCTTDASYGMRITLPTSTTWYMDNAMQDASTAIMRHFLQVLREDGR
jgi:hypothetical protein